MTSTLLMDLFVRGIFLLMIGLASYLIYQLITPEQKRQLYRTRLKNQFREKKDDVVQGINNSTLSQRLTKLNMPFTAFHYQIARLSLLLVFTFYYVIYPLVDYDQALSLVNIMIIGGLVILSEPKVKFSITAVILNLMEKRLQKRKATEVFTLYSLIKVELDNDDSKMKTNVYHFLKDSQNLFDDIQGTITRFLALWKTSPELAKDVFYEDIGTDEAKTLGDILYRVDRVPKQEGLKIIKDENEAFSHAFFEQEVEHNMKRTRRHFVFATVTVFVIILWVFMYIAQLVQGYIGVPM